ncbi:MAG: transposase [Oligoflexia bacterium]|nr:transposase [Oligoflexia bacterium]
MARKNKELQLTLPGLTRKTRNNAHGGGPAVGKRKERRPFDPRQALHVVLRSSKARGELSMLHPRHCNPVRALVWRLKERWGVRVYQYANAGNHLHLLVRARSRASWQGFIRELAGGVAMIVTGAKKGNPLNPGKAAGARGFWDHLVFTRIVSFGRDFRNVAAYVLKNLWEASGVPVRKLLARGYQCLDLSEDGAVLLSRTANSEARAWLERAVAPG